MPIPRVRFSVLSFIVMVNMAGVMIWANVRERHIVVFVKEDLFSIAGSDESIVVHGWPLNARWVDRIGFQYWHLPNIIVDGEMALGLVTAFTYLTEVFIRRLREAKHSTPDAHP